ncbi:hypothetical protein P4054_26125 [Pseudomonas aeruginosa]|nr:hypothetical protein [Pseudomonas aeruginosa]
MLQESVDEGPGIAHRTVDDLYSGVADLDLLRRPLDHGKPRSKASSSSIWTARYCGGVEACNSSAPGRSASSGNVMYTATSAALGLVMARTRAMTPVWMSILAIAAQRDGSCSQEATKLDTLRARLMLRCQLRRLYSGLEPQVRTQPAGQRGLQCQQFRAYGLDTVHQVDVVLSQLAMAGDLAVLVVHHSTSGTVIADGQELVRLIAVQQNAVAKGVGLTVVIQAFAFDDQASFSPTPSVLGASPGRCSFYGP